MAEVDVSSYRDNVLQSPFDMSNKLLENQLKQQAVQENSIKLATERFGMVNNAAAGLLSDPDLGQKDITPKLWDVLGRLTKGDAMSAQHAVQFMQGLPRDPMMQRQAIQNVHAQTLDAWQRGQAYLGRTQAVSTGGGTKFYGAPAFGNGPIEERGYQPNTVPPTTPQYGANNKQTYVGGSGNAPLELPGNNLQPPTPPAPPQAAPNRLLGGASPPPAPAPMPAAPAPAVRARSGYQPPGSIVAAPPPGSVEAQQVAGTESGKSLADARNRSLNFKQEVFPLEQAIPALEKLGTKGSGPGTESINHLKSFVLSNIPGADFKGLKDDVAIYDKAKQYLTDFVNQNGNSGTNDKLAAAFAGNPSVNISNAAAVDVAKSALSLRRMKQAQLVAFEHSGLPESDYAKFASKWNAHADPRAYGFDLMTPAQRKRALVMARSALQTKGMKARGM
ncbi:MAG: hypothetical protein E8A46_27880, partial [Bradyrhizobium sp.]